VKHGAHGWAAAALLAPARAELLRGESVVTAPRSAPYGVYPIRIAADKRR
jgi:hypothetical protein